MSNRTIITLLNAATTASAAGSALCDYRFDQGDQNRTLAGTLVSCELNVYVYFDTARTFAHLETTISAGSSSFNAATNSFVEIFNGPFVALEVRKVGAEGTATVIGIL